MIENILNNFVPIGLEEINKAQLMNRIDTKFCVKTDVLPELLSKISESYFILKIDENCVQKYYTNYFDTTENTMFYDHIRGKLNRYKIRIRKYETSGISFFEIKHKTNKGRVIKKRTQLFDDFKAKTFQYQIFIESYSPYKLSDLKMVMGNEFQRITLVEKNLSERVTIDLNLRFRDKYSVFPVDSIAIIEIKSDRMSKTSALQTLLSSYKILPCGFSKYVAGRALTNNMDKFKGLKPEFNRFLQTL